MPPTTTTTTTSERRRDAPPPPRSSRPPRALVEVLAEEHRDAYDNILSRLDSTSRALLAEASPILADAQTARLAPGERAPRVNNERLVDSVSLLELALRRGLCRKSSVPSSTTILVPDAIARRVSRNSRAATGLTSPITAWLQTAQSSST